MQKSGDCAGRLTGKGEPDGILPGLRQEGDARKVFLPGDLHIIREDQSELSAAGEQTRLCADKIGKGNEIGNGNFCGHLSAHAGHKRPVGGSDALHEETVTGKVRKPEALLCGVCVIRGKQDGVSCVAQGKEADGVVAQPAFADQVEMPGDEGTGGGIAVEGNGREDLHAGARVLGVESQQNPLNRVVHIPLDEVQAKSRRIRPQRLLRFLQEGRGMIIANTYGDRPEHKGVFSDEGHYIVLAEANGTEIKVWDPMYREGSGRYDVPGRAGKVRLEGTDAFADFSEIEQDCWHRPFFLFWK